MIKVFRRSLKVPSSEEDKKQKEKRKNAKTQKQQKQDQNSLYAPPTQILKSQKTYIYEIVSRFIETTLTNTLRLEIKKNPTFRQEKQIDDRLNVYKERNETIYDAIRLNPENNKLFTLTVNTVNQQHCILMFSNSNSNAALLNNTIYMGDVEKRTLKDFIKSIISHVRVNANKISISAETIHKITYQSNYRIQINDNELSYVIGIPSYPAAEVFIAANDPCTQTPIAAKFQIYYYYGEKYIKDTNEWQSYRSRHPIKYETKQTRYLYRTIVRYHPTVIFNKWQFSVWQCYYDIENAETESYLAKKACSWYTLICEEKEEKEEKEEMAIYRQQGKRNQHASSQEQVALNGGGTYNTKDVKMLPEKVLLILTGNGETAEGGIDTGWYDNCLARYYYDKKQKQLYIQPYITIRVDYPGTATGTKLAKQDKQIKLSFGEAKKIMGSFCDTLIRWACYHGTQDVIRYQPPANLKDVRGKKIDVYARSIGGFVLRCAFESPVFMHYKLPIDNVWFERTMVNIKAITKTLGSFESIGDFLGYGASSFYKLAKWCRDLKDIDIDQLLRVIYTNPQTQFHVLDSENDLVMRKNARLAKWLDTYTTLPNIHCHFAGKIGHNGGISTNTMNSFFHSFPSPPLLASQTSAQLLVSILRRASEEVRHRGKSFRIAGSTVKMAKGHSNYVVPNGVETAVNHCFTVLRTSPQTIPGELITQLQAHAAKSKSRKCRTDWTTKLYKGPQNGEDATAFFREMIYGHDSKILQRALEVINLYHQHFCKCYKKIRRAHNRNVSKQINKLAEDKQRAHNRNALEQIKKQAEGNQALYYKDTRLPYDDNISEKIKAEVKGNQALQYVLVYGIFTVIDRLCHYTHAILILFKVDKELIRELYFYKTQLEELLRNFELQRVIIATCKYMMSLRTGFCASSAEKNAKKDAKGLITTLLSLAKIQQVSDKDIKNKVLNIRPESSKLLTLKFNQFFSRWTRKCKIIYNAEPCSDYENNISSSSPPPYQNRRKSLSFSGKSGGIKGIDPSINNQNVLMFPGGKEQVPEGFKIFVRGWLSQYDNSEIAYYPPFLEGWKTQSQLRNSGVKLKELFWEHWSKQMINGQQYTIQIDILHPEDKGRESAYESKQYSILVDRYTVGRKESSSDSNSSSDDEKYG